MTIFISQENEKIIKKTYIKLQSGAKLLRQNRKSIFQWKNPSPPNQCCWQIFRLLTTKLGQIQHWYWGVRGRIWNLKNWVISWIYWIFNFCLNKFCPGLYLRKIYGSWIDFCCFVFKTELINNSGLYFCLCLFPIHINLFEPSVCSIVVQFLQFLDPFHL